MPGNSGDGLLRMIEVWVVPERGRVRCRCAEEAGVFGVGDLRGGEQEGVDPDAMDRAFAILAGGRSPSGTIRRGCGQGRLERASFACWVDVMSGCPVSPGIKFTSAGRRGVQ